VFYLGDRFLPRTLDGLITAEVELPSEETVFERPVFVTEDVTERVEYKNSSLAANGLPLFSEGQLSSFEGRVGV